MSAQMGYGGASGQDCDSEGSGYIVQRAREDWIIGGSGQGF